MIWELKHPQMTYDALGYVPDLINERDPRPAKEQLNQNYAHGGGWNPSMSAKFKITEKGLHYPGDPPMKLLAQAKLRDERLLFFECSWLAIVQPDGTFEVSRVD